MPDPIKTIIGFDFGSHWIGVAIGQTLTRQASPLPALKTNDWDGIKRVLDTWQPQILVVGLPLNMTGDKQLMTSRAQRFSRQLQGRFGVVTELIDERLTTREAQLIAREGRGTKSKTEIDSLAAVLITESWLREHDAIG